MQDLFGKLSYQNFGRVLHERQEFREILGSLVWKDVLAVSQSKVTVEGARIGGEGWVPWRMQLPFPDITHPGISKRGAPMGRQAVVVLTPAGNSLQSSTLLLDSENPRWEGSSVVKCTSCTCFNFSTTHGFCRNLICQGPPLSPLLLLLPRHCKKDRLPSTDPAPTFIQLTEEPSMGPIHSTGVC